MTALRNLRKQQNMTQDELAEKLGIGRTTVAMWELGESMPKSKTLRLLSEILNCTVDELLKKDKTEKE